MAAQRFPDYNDMADNKAYLESVASFGYFLKDKLELILFPNHQRLQRQVKLLKALMVSLHLLINGTVNASALDCANYTVAVFRFDKNGYFKIFYMMADSLIWE
jgi:hypothetical protein